VLVLTGIFALSELRNCGFAFRELSYLETEECKYYFYGYGHNLISMDEVHSLPFFSLLLWKRRILHFSNFAKICYFEGMIK
jgi:hypothetical protein